MVDQKEKRLSGSNTGSQREYVVEINGERYDFSSLPTEYNGLSRTALAQAWCSSFATGNASTVKLRFYSLRRFFRWVVVRSAKETLAQEFIGAINSETHLSQDKMFDLVDAFASRVRDLNCKDIVTSTNPKSRKPLLETLSTTLQKLALEGLWPDIGPIRGIDGRLVQKRTMRSLGELERQHLGGKAIPRSLREKIVRVDALNVERLSALRSVMVEELKGQYSHFIEGRRIINLEVPFKYSEIQNIFEPKDGQGSEIALSWYRASDAETQEMALACLLKWITKDHFGLVQTTSFPNIVQKLIWKFGGQKKVTGYLEGSHDALFPAHTIVMIDTAFNVQTCDDLSVDPFVGAIKSGSLEIETISARKRRAAGKIVEATVEGGVAELRVGSLAASLSTIETLKIWQEMSAPIRKRVQSRQIKELLWIVPAGTNNLAPISRYNTVTFHSWWLKFLERISDHSVLGGLNFQRKMIRPTVLQISASKNKLSHIVPQVIANHGSAGSTYQYLSSSWFKEKLAEQVREFQNLFEASFSRDMKEFAVRLGISRQELINRQALAEETGLGFVCGLKQRPESKVKNCLDIDKCTKCDFRRFVPTKSALESLCLANWSLKNQEDIFRAQNPDRWMDVWMPYLALTEALISRLRRSRFSKALGDAEKIVQRKLEESVLQIIQLW